MASGMDRQGDVPGLKSVATATAAPAVRRSLTGGGRAPRNSVDTGRTVATVSEPPRARTPSASVWFRWSALRAPSATAACAAPDAPSWSAWHRTASPCARAAPATARRSSTVNAMSSTYTSTASTSCSAAARGISSAHTASTQPTRVKPSGTA
jgi:hypothetical protein